MRVVLLTALCFAGTYSQLPCSDQAAWGDTIADKADTCASFSTSDECGCTYVGPFGEGCSAAICPTTTVAPVTTIAVPPTTTVPPTTQDCAYWASSRVTAFSASAGASGAPLNVCFGAFSGIELTSVSHMYRCSGDESTVEYWWWTGSSDCNEGGTATTTAMLPFVFDAALYPDTDFFNCAATPCPYFIIEDATAHPTQTCPYDVGKDYLTGEEDYATWHLKLLLQGCQTFDGLTSIKVQCSSSGGISLLNFVGPTCDAGNLVAAPELFNGGTIECNYGTGRSVYCFDDDADDTKTTTAAPVTTADPVTTATPISTASGTSSGTTKDATTTVSSGTGSSGTTLANSGCSCLTNYTPFCCDDTEQFGNGCLAICAGYNVPQDCVQEECADVDTTSAPFGSASGAAKRDMVMFMAVSTALLMMNV